MPKKFHSQDPHYEREQKKYDEPVPSREWLLETLKSHPKGLHKKELYKRFSLYEPQAQEGLRRRLIAMCRDGQLIRNPKGRYLPVQSKPELEGVVRIRHDGSMWIQVAGDATKYHLAYRFAKSLMGGDQVCFVPQGQNTKGQDFADQVELIQARSNSVIGRTVQIDGRMYLKSLDKSFHEDILLEGKSLDPGVYVSAQLLGRPIRGKPLKAKVKASLGTDDTSGIEARVCLASHGICTEWDGAVMQEAASCEHTLSKETIKGRRDLRTFPFVTIDGDDAKDFDDAVYAQKLENDEIKLWVAIADVSYYVKEQSALDKVALERGNSIYLPTQVVPMLPEVLANNLCSLKPEVDRLVMVCEMRVSAQGEVLDYEFYEGVIHSVARLTYTQVSEWLAHKKSKALPYVDSLQNLEVIMQRMLKKRASRGALDFASNEMSLVMDAQQKIIDLRKQVRLDSHRLIEECMLLANVCAADFCVKHQLCVPHRVHDQPDPKKLTDLRLFLQHYGLKLEGGDSPKPSDYAALLDQTKLLPHASVCQSIILRSMKQAIYSVESVGHFGLAYEHYLHFTSPIRRYPDLLVHRAMKAKLNEGHYHQEQAILASERCSLTERQADKIAREVQDWMLARFMKPHVGEVFSAVVVSVNSFGFFVAIEPWHIEGLVHVKDLQGGFYHFDATAHQLVADRSGHVISLGDELQVQCIRVSIDERQIDFMPYKQSSSPKAQQSKKSAASRKTKPPKKKRRKKGS